MCLVSISLSRLCSFLFFFFFFFNDTATTEIYTLSLHDALPIFRRRYKCTTNSDHDQPVARNLLERQFEADAPNQRWVGDRKSTRLNSSHSSISYAVFCLKKKKKKKLQLQYHNTQNPRNSTTHNT